MTPDDLLRRLESLGITAETKQHPPVFTVEESRRLRGEIVGAHTKNLFLRNKKGTMWLVVCREDRTVDLEWLAAALGTKRLSFGSADRLSRYLGVIPGAVTPFGVINDVDRKVRVVLDVGIKEDVLWNFHPLDNSMTTSITPSDMLRFLEAEGHTPIFLDFDRPETHD